MKGTKRAAKAQIRNTKHEFTWDRNYKNRRITQFYTCQEWGHATLNFRSRSKYLKCARPHRVCDCDPNLTKLKCANCAGNHTANNTMLNLHKKNPGPPSDRGGAKEIHWSISPQNQPMVAKENPTATPTNAAVVAVTNTAAIPSSAQPSNAPHHWPTVRLKVPRLVSARVFSVSPQSSKKCAI